MCSRRGYTPAAKLIVLDSFANRVNEFHARYFQVFYRLTPLSFATHQSLIGFRVGSGFHPHAYTSSRSLWRTVAYALELTV